MDSRYHLLVSGAFAVPFLLSQEYQMGLFIILLGSFIDIDHEVDYFMLHRKLVLHPLRVSRGLGKLWGKSQGHMYMPLHALEWVLVTGILLPVPLFIAYAIHLGMDWGFNDFPLQFYSILYRWRHQWYLPDRTTSPK